MKAPGAKTKINAPYSSGKITALKIRPVPKNSLTEPSIVRAKVNPSPIPTPSRSESNGVFFAAKDSARPRTIQFTTIRGMKSPRLS